MFSECRGRAAIRSGPAAFEVHLELLPYGGSGRRRGISRMALLQIASGAVRTIIWKKISHLTRSDMLREVYVVIVVMRGQIEERVQVAMTHYAMP